MSSETLDPFAFAGQDEVDAELFALIAEYRRVERKDEDNISDVFEKIDQ